MGGKSDDCWFTHRVMSALPTSVARPGCPATRGMILAGFHALAALVGLGVVWWIPPGCVARWAGGAADRVLADPHHSCFWAPLDAIATTVLGPHPMGTFVSADWALFGLAVGVAWVATRAHTAAP